MDFDRVAGLDAVAGAVAVARIGEFRLAQAVRLVALESAVFAAPRGDREARAFVFGIGVRVDVAQIQFRSGRCNCEHAGVRARRACDVPGRLRAIALADLRSVGRACEKQRYRQQRKATISDFLHDSFDPLLKRSPLDAKRYLRSARLAIRNLRYRRRSPRSQYGTPPSMVQRCMTRRSSGG